MNSSRPLQLLALTLAASACQRSAAESPAPHAASAPATAASPDGCAAAAQLAAMDTRKPVPLQPMMAWHQKQNMMEHLVAIHRITAALAQQDWDEIAKAAALIESSPQMQQMCQHMGAGAEGFTDLALEFHHRADAIAPAARAQDTAAVLTATAHTLEACTRCHATYRQQVMDAQAWEAKTGSSLAH